jgi:ribonuclease HI
MKEKGLLDKVEIIEAEIFCDGASRGNPGDSGIGVVISLLDGTGRDYRISEYIGVATNNVAEYSALIRGLEEARSLGVRRINVFLDSELVVRQINGIYKVRNNNLRVLWSRARVILMDFDSYVVKHVERKRNADADALAGDAVIQKGR